VSPRVRRLAWAGLTAASLVAIGYIWVWILQRDFLNDARAYWSVDYGNLYGGSLVGRFGTYLYSPAFAQAMWPATLLPWAVFAALWCALNLGLLVWMAGPVLAAILLFAPFSPITDEITTGNVHLLIAAAIVIGFRWSAAHALPLLTKITTGVGVLWFVGAGRYRRFATTVGVTIAICAASFIIAPQQWFDWVDLLRRSATVSQEGAGVIPGPLWLRGAMATALALAGGRLGWRWTVPVAATVALPVTWSSGLAILVALIPLARERLSPVGARMTSC
jgi:Glycosyltransferase family 87